MPQAFTFSVHPSTSVSNDLLAEAATLFSSEYGVWGPQAAEKTGGLCKPGQRIRLNATRLRQQSLIDAAGSESVLVCCRGADGGELVGQVFATRWRHEGRRVCWITQLRVRAEFRRKEIATKMLRLLKVDAESDAPTIFGILSSHPAALLAFLRALVDGVEGVNMEFIQRHAEGIMASSPVPYVRDAKLEVTLLEDALNDSLCCADTKFWVDHGEPLKVLEEVKRRIEWPFGALLEGFEWLAIAEGQRTVGEDSG